MIKTEGLLGLPWNPPHNDCYSLMRAFYRINFGIEVPDIARPDLWWEPDERGDHLNLYLDNYLWAGFGLFHGHPREWLPGDIILMAIRAPVANHGAVLLPGERILHHFMGQLSEIGTYNRPIWRDTTVAVLRHPGVDGVALLEETEIDAMDLLPPRVREQLEAARQGQLDV